MKWDGARAIAFAEGGRVSLRSRNGKDVTATFPDLAHMAEHLGMSAVILDGEILALGDDGRPSFARLQNRLHVGDPREARRRAATDPVDFVAFDLLYADGRSLMGLPYDERRARLEALAFNGPHFTTTECFRDLSGSDVLRGITANGLEGVVAKRRDSVYRPGRRSSDWVKVKTSTTQEVVIGGWTDGKGGRAGDLGSLLMGDTRGGRPHLRRQGGDGLQRPRPPGHRGEADPAEGNVQPVRQHRHGGRGQGCALRQTRAGGRGGLRRVDAGRAAPAPEVERPAARQGSGRRHP